MSTSSDNRNPVEVLAEEFLDRNRRGEAVTPEEYAQAHPELADEILALFPSLLMMEDLAATPAARTSSLVSEAGAAVGATDRAAGRVPAAARGRPRRHGRRLRGRAGDRSAAAWRSKVLPASVLTDTKQVRRFEREARSAARLHHTNIVPVFGVGQHEGTHYYVMQFIQGQGLDAVLDELKRLRDSRARHGPATAGPRARQQA